MLVLRSLFIHYYAVFKEATLLPLHIVKAATEVFAILPECSCVDIKGRLQEHFLGVHACARARRLERGADMCT